MEPNLFKYILRHTRVEQAYILAVVLVSMVFYYLALNLPKDIVNEAIQGHSFPEPTSTVSVLTLHFTLPGWLGGVMTSRVKNEVVRAKLIAYQRDLYKVAWAVFGPMQASVRPARPVEAMAQRLIEITNRVEAIDETLLTLTAMLRDLAASAEQMKAVSVVVEGLKTEMDSLRAELADLDTDHIYDTLLIFRERILDLKNDTRFKYILVFKNHGISAGASLEHSHSQLIATPIIPRILQDELEGSRAANPRGNRK